MPGFRGGASWLLNGRSSVDLLARRGDAPEMREACRQVALQHFARGGGGHAANGKAIHSKAAAGGAFPACCQRMLRCSESRLPLPAVPRSEKAGSVPWRHASLRVDSALWLERLLVQAARNCTGCTFSAPSNPRPAAVTKRRVKGSPPSSAPSFLRWPARTFENLSAPLFSFSLPKSLPHVSPSSTHSVRCYLA